MYFCIYFKSDIGIIFFKTLDYIDINDGIDLYKLKIRITEIEQRFDEYCLLNSGSYCLRISNYNPDIKKED